MSIHLFSLQISRVHYIIKVYQELMVSWHAVLRKHYVENLCRLIRLHGLETLWLLTSDDLETLVRRQGLCLPPRSYSTPLLHYYNELMEVLLRGSFVKSLSLAHSILELMTGLGIILKFYNCNGKLILLEVILHCKRLSTLQWVEN